MKKKLLEILLTLVMLLIFVPAGVLAEDAAYEAVEAENAAAETSKSDGTAAETTAAAEASGSCGYSLTWALDDDGTLTISGTGDMDNSYEGVGAPWYSSSDRIRKVVLSHGVTSIGNWAFYGCSGLTDITIPDSVTSIADQAFYGCSGLTTITIPDSVTYIDVAVFEGCSGLTSVTVGDGVTTLSGFEFFSYPNLKSVVIGNSVTQISDYAFSGCSNLESVTIGNSVTSIWQNAFSGCSGLKNITIPGSVTLIGYDAFSGCTSLTTVNYTGEEKNWDNIQIYTGNDCLISAERNTVHSYTAKHYAATCTDCGYAVYTCACGSTYTAVEEPAAGHRFVKSSETLWTCSVCGQKSSAYGLNNLSLHTYTGSYTMDASASTVKSYLVETSAGKLLTIWSSDGCVLNVETRNAAGTLESSRQIVLDYPTFGGFYEGADAYYVACGQSNPNQDDWQAVIRIIRYSKDWVRQGAATLYGRNTYLPFAGGSLRMTEASGELYVYTCRHMYSGHQGSLAMAVDESTMEVVDDTSTDFYVSHSFNQFVQTDGTDVYLADHGDAYPRAIFLLKCSVGGFTDCRSCYPYTILGTTGDNATGVSVGGMELSANNVLIAASSVDMTNASGYDPAGQQNIMLTVTDKNLAATKVVWLTNYKGSEGVTVGTPFLVKLSDDRFMLLWEESKNYSVSCVKEVVTDENGKALYTAALQNYRLSDCQPVVTADGNVRWFTRDSSGNTKVYKVAAQSWIHSWDAGRLAQPVTDTQDGLVVYTCRICGETRTVTLPAGGSPFIDVQNTDDYYYEPVLWAAANGIVYGTSDFEFSPDVSCTRAQVVTFLYRAAGEPAVSGTNPFTDVKSGEYYYEAVLWGYQNGIVYGTSDTTFSPDARVTRAQFITFLYRFAKEPTPSGTASPFKDVPADEYYTDAVLWGYQNGIVYGTDEDKFSPDDSCTRAQVVTFLHRYLVK